VLDVKYGKGVEKNYPRVDIVLKEVDDEFARWEKARPEGNNLDPRAPSTY
jgi:hypothetical protein